MSELKYVFSADSHIVEPFDLWTNALGAKHGDLLPQEVSHCNGVQGKYFYTGIEYIQIADLDPTDTADSGADSSGLDPELEAKVMRTNDDPALRLELMDLDGVAAEFITSTWMLFSMRIQDMAVVRDCCSVYNDWVAEYCSHDPKRLLASAMIAMEDVDWAVAELEKAARRDMRGAVIYCDTKPHMLPYRHRHYDRFWAAAQDLNMPVMLHIVTGQVQDLYTLQTPAERQLIPRLSLELFQEGGLVLANEFIFGGVLDRFPKLQLILGEFEISWLPNYMFRLKQLQGALGQSVGLRKTDRPIEEYFATQVWHGFVDDEYFDRSYDVAGPTRILWGSDFPHPRNTFPNSHAILERVLKNVPDQVRADVAGLNAARLFGVEVPQGLTIAAE